MNRCFVFVALAFVLSPSVHSQEARSGPDFAVALPSGVHAAWSIEKAYRESTPTRERVSINGLWRWQPAATNSLVPPSNHWGFFKSPAPWPGIQDYLQSDYHTLFKHPSWAGANIGAVRAAWQEREVSIPESWKARRISIDLSYLNSYASVFIDGKRIGELRFPGGELDITAAVRPGATHLLSLLVEAMPLKAVMESYTDTNNARQRPGKVERRGICGDAWLVAEPDTARIRNVKVDTSFRRGELKVSATLEKLDAAKKYRVRAVVSDGATQVAEFTGETFAAEQLTNAVATLATNWLPKKLWDLHTPQNQFTLQVSLLDSSGSAVDVALPVRFGFRELWIDGRDLYLNGSRLYLSLLPLDNAQVGAALATYEAAKESFRRLQSFGINFLYGHNYGCEPGSHLSFEEILRAADDTGMLIALSQPHFSAYDWKSSDADRTNGYAGHAAFYTAVAGNHPSVVCYSMSHNSTGYNEDMNPWMMDGLRNPRDQWSGRNAALALRCEAIVKGLDPARLVYHHSSGDLSSMFTINFYPNFVPMQEMDDWFGHWSKEGNKPMLLVEYGAPFGWDWTMYRGWFEGKREFGSAAVPWEYCMAEWNAQFLGDSVYKISDREKQNIKWEAQQFRRRRAWFRWDYPNPVGSSRLEEMQPVQAAYTTHNWRAFRTWGLTGNSPWEHDRFWKLREGFQPRRKELAVDWDAIQRPGYSPDFIDRTYARFDLAYERSDWVASPTAQSLIRNNGPVLAWIAGKPEQFTTKDHLFNAGEGFEKQLVIINNSRVTVSGEASWSCNVGQRLQGKQHVEIPTGQQVAVPIKVSLPKSAGEGRYTIEASFIPAAGEPQQDSFQFDVVPQPRPTRFAAKAAVFDPQGETVKWLQVHDIKARAVESSSDLSGFDVLFIGKRAISVDGPLPDLKRVKDGLKVIVFEQTGEALEQRLGFRVAEYGLRQVWARVPDSPLLAGLSADSLSDWRGSSTLLPEKLNYTLSPRYNGAPTVRWCGLEVTRLWRCGNRGNVSSVLIEKPLRGDFVPVLEGGYALQYSPLLEYREGKGLVLFCQLDITGRTEREPAADILANNILKYVENWRPAEHRTAVYAGDPAGLQWLKACGIDAVEFKDQTPSPDQLLVVSGGSVSQNKTAVADWIRNRGKVLLLGTQAEKPGEALVAADRLTTVPGEHLATWFPCFESTSPFAGISPADLHNRDPRNYPLIRGAAKVHASGLLAEEAGAVFCQVLPWEFSTEPEKFNQRRTFVRSSYALNRLLSNLGVVGATPLLERFAATVAKDQPAAPGRFLEGLYLTKPTEWDDPYRFFRW